jgi:hypothetical protein
MGAVVQRGGSLGSMSIGAAVGSAVDSRPRRDMLDG